ncbi:AAA family ATPase [Deferribacteraceae bacterium V6Fe1]|nr:AAA family ATPase [Deferribacteraceae bacterium V6Fe1]
MINKIVINNAATFTQETIINLKKINFFHGSNGTGKSTISRILASPNNFSACKINWLNNREIKTIVFNEDFTRRSFYEKDKLNGIYTIGESASHIEEQINQKKQDFGKTNEELNKLKATKGKKDDEKKKNFNDFKEKCWDGGYLKLQNDFDSFFTGYKKDKEKLANKILEESETNNASLLSKDDLKKKYDLIYNKDTQKIENIPLFQLDEITKIEEEQDILNTSIIGKSDVDIARMIEKLHNYDWVKRGKEFYENNYDEGLNAYICPFCQQQTPENFRKQLEEYFDETYQENIKKLNSFIQHYKSTTDDISNKVKQIIDSNNQYLEDKKKTLSDKKDVLEGLINQNLQLLEQKHTNPSEKIELKPISPTLNEINEILEEVNKNIKQHNNLIDNKRNEKDILDKAIWKYIVNQLKSDIDSYNEKKSEIYKAIQSLETQIKANSNKETE